MTAAAKPTKPPTRQAPATPTPTGAPAPSTPDVPGTKRRISWDAVFVVGGGLVGTWWLLHRGGTSSGSGVVQVMGPAQQSAQPAVPDLFSTMMAPPSGPGADPGPADWWSQLYRSADNRTPDTTGAAWWSAETVAVGQAQATREFLSTPEAVINSDYQQAFGRYADPSGLSFYANELASGVTNQQIQAQLAASQEAKLRAAH